MRESNIQYESLKLMYKKALKGVCLEVYFEELILVYNTFLL